MVLSGVLFFALSFATYFLLSLFGQLTGGSGATLVDSIGRMFRPIPLLVLIASNIFFASALYFGFQFSKFAIPMAIAVGVVASFVYSMLFLGGTVSAFKLLGVALILVGIYLLR